MWNLPPPPGFQGFREGLAMRIYVRNLPHWRQDGATYFATFRLADSLPQSKLNELRRFRQDWEALHPLPRSAEQADELVRELVQRIERWLDKGIGSCILRRIDVVPILTEALHHFDGLRYELGCYVIMPNHVHAVLRPLAPDQIALEELLGGWKKHTALEINRLLARSGKSLWQDESFDRIIRDEEHLFRVIQYIGNNPAFANLPIEQCPRWIRPEWVALGWTFDSPAAA